MRIIGLLICLVFSACNNERQSAVASAPLISIHYTDDLGNTLNFPNTPERVISLAPNITEMMYALGAEDRLIACSQACDYPLATQLLPRVFTYPELDTESILGFNPDLILATTEIFPAELGAWFGNYKIPVLFQSYTSLSDVYRNMEQLSVLLGMEEKGKSITGKMRSVSDSIALAHSKQTQYSVMILVNANPLCIAGKRSYMDDLIRMGGGKNIGGLMDQAYPEVSLEFILKQDPDFILLPAKDDASALQFITQNPILASLNAVREKRLIRVNPDVYFRPGPRTLEALIEIADLLHPGE